MGLRLKLNVLLSLVFCVALAIAVVYLLTNARRAVLDELRASTELASTLMQGVLGSPVSNASNGAIEAMAAQLQRHAAIRHLRISLVAGPVAGDGAAAPALRAADVPAWFSRLVRPAPDALTRLLEVHNGNIVIAADPNDEIVEAWRETKTTLLVLLAVFAGANVAVFIFLGRALLPLQGVSRALAGIEQGLFAERLPTVGVPEIDQIVERYNHMAEALQRSHADNLMLAQRSLAIQEEERRHLAHELHDEMGQSITAIKALAVSIRERLEGSEPALAERAATITDVSSDIYARVRRMMTQLHPVVLDELGLAAALELMVDDWNMHHAECFCTLVAPRDLPVLTAAARIGIYRIVQEALTNIARHSRASEARIELAVTSTDGAISSIVLDIVDNGIGFDVEHRRRGLGLLGIQERVNAMNGKLDIETQPGAGVRICMRAPIEPPAHALAGA